MSGTVGRRGVDRVQGKRWLGPDAQVDDKAMVFEPTSPAFTRLLTTFLDGLNRSHWRTTR